MSIGKTVYQILWHLLLFVAEITDRILWWWTRVQEYVLRCSTLYENFQRGQTMSLDEADRDLLEEGSKHLTKLPKHVNIIIARDSSSSKINDNALIRILNYALIMNIECISFFDCRIARTNAFSSKCNSNTISTNSWRRTKLEPLHLDRLRCPKQIQWKRANQYHATWFLPPNGSIFNSIANGYHKERSQKFINGTMQKKLSLGHSINQKTKCLQIYEIRDFHGRPLLAEVCQDFYRRREFSSLCLLSSSEMRSKLMEKITSELLVRLEKLCEPDLTILFDQRISLYGILPWHTRFTEFQLAKNTDGQFRAQHFLRILYKYARCEQRYGK